MNKTISILASPEEALTIKNHIIPVALLDPIDAICERSITLCHLFNLYLSSKEVFNHHVSYIVWQLQGNTNLLDLYLKNYLASSVYYITQGLIARLDRLCSEVNYDYSELQQAPRQALPKTSKLVVKIKQLFISIKTYCYESQL